MRFFRWSHFRLVLVTVASAADLKIKVIDPQSAAVAGAQVELLEPGGTVPLGVKTSSAERARGLSYRGRRPYAVRVLAQGFARAAQGCAGLLFRRAVTVQLRLAPAAETIVVTATRSPVPSESAGAEVEHSEQQPAASHEPDCGQRRLRFLPGAIVDTTGQRGGLASLFVRGGDSTYNKVIVDGVTINTPGGGFDFGTLPLTEADHLEFMRGAQSTLYGSDAMTSVVQVWTRTGSTPFLNCVSVPTAATWEPGTAMLRLPGPVVASTTTCSAISSTPAARESMTPIPILSKALTLGLRSRSSFSSRSRFRHSNSHTGVPGEWDFNGQPLEPPDPGEWSQLNNLIGSVELTVVGPSGWQHRFTGFDYNYRYTDLNLNGDTARVDALEIR